MKLALVIDAQPKLFRAMGNRSRLRKGQWHIKAEGMVDSVLAVYHAMLDNQDKPIGNYDKYLLENDKELTLAGPAYCYVEFLTSGNEKSISVFAHT